MQDVISESASYLGVASSACGRRWVGLGPLQERAAQAIVQSAGVPEIVARILASRGVPPEDVGAYLAPSLRELMPDPYVLRDMERAATRFWRAVRNRERIAIFADYDVDGGGAAALLIIWLRKLGLAATLYVPDRILEGYGPNVGAMQTLGAAHDLIVCVDCGALSHEPIAAAGCDVLVLDHHLGGEALPPAVAVVNPNRQDETGDLAYLCAAGVVLMMLVAVNRLMRAEGAAGPNLLPLLDIVALATVADVAPLVGLNRAFVRQGLRAMRPEMRPGLAALAEISGVKGEPGVYALGFQFGPRINAGGRIGAADLGARLLATDDPHEATALAARLNAFNAERREIEAAVLTAARRQVEARPAGNVVWAAGDGWHPGVVGIVAARLKEEFERPAIVIGFDGAKGKGSGRSAAGFDLGAAVARLLREGLIELGGGHRMAAGLSLSRAQLEPAMARLGEMVAQGPGAESPARELRIDGLIAPRSATLALCEQIASAGPFGAGSPAPRVAVASAQVVGVRRVGEGHLAFGLTDAGGGRLDAVAFRAANGPLGDLIAQRPAFPVHVAGRLEKDEWGGRARAKLHVEDMAAQG